jgi:hypothetical protein
MTINSINSLDPNDPNNPVNQDRFRARMEQALTPVAQLFHETPDQLINELQSGNTSLSDLAQSKGVSQDDLVAAIKQGLTNTPGGSPLSDTQLTNIANRIANHRHGGHHHHHQGVSQTSQSSPSLSLQPLSMQSAGLNITSL